MNVLAQASPAVPCEGKRGVGRWDRSLRAEVMCNGCASVEREFLSCFLICLLGVCVRWRAVGAKLGNTNEMPRIKKPKVCSECGSKKIAKIEYGLPYFSEEERQQVEAGKIVLGGCVLTGDDPDWQCVDCGKSFPEPRELPVGD